MHDMTTSRVESKRDQYKCSTMNYLYSFAKEKKKNICDSLNTKCKLIMYYIITKKFQLTSTEFY